MNIISAIEREPGQDLLAYFALKKYISAPTSLKPNILDTNPRKKLHTKFKNFKYFLTGDSLVFFHLLELSLKKICLTELSHVTDYTILMQ